MQFLVRALLASLFICSFALAGTKAQEPARLELVVIETVSGAHTFNTEIADTPALRERGLMFRHKLPADHAMLFDWSTDQVVTMWMRNTYISLDMIFISRYGRIATIAEYTEPQSLDIISSGVPVAAVLEVAAGTVRRIRAKPGDRVTHRIFTQQ